jgi:EAL domain-containing protein (putative c-di-GMP-specific phosphodiesterase class I)/DNA-binding response OmpR family regulator
MIEREPTRTIKNLRKDDGRRPLVLLLDDDIQMSSFVRAVLSDRNYDVRATTTVSAAIESAEMELPDLAFVDIGLEVNTGWDFLRYLRGDERFARIPVAMLTASGDRIDRERSLTLGADRYLLKPVSPELLRRTAAELLASRNDLWWSLSLGAPQISRLRDVLHDTSAEVPTLAFVVEELRAAIGRNQQLQVFCIEIDPLMRVEERSFWESLDAIRRDFVRSLHLIAPHVLGEGLTIATSHAGANDFYCFAPADPSRNVTDLAKELEDAARDILRKLAEQNPLASETMIFVGGAVTNPEPVYASRMLYNAAREAKEIAARRESRYMRELSDRLTRAVRDRQIHTVFQPIIDLKSGLVHGFEALSRGPAGTEIESPEVIFDLARDLQLIWELETLCIENLAPYLRSVCSGGKLFFNVESHFIQQLHHRGLEVLDPLLDCTEFVVIEVTERSAIRDYSLFRRTLHDLKKMGFRIAVDDCGSGYATLEAVAELHPDYLKVGHSLFSNVEKDPIRRQIIELVARCADTIGAQTIAEAIETREQLQICREIGIGMGQGHLFAKASPWEEISRVLRYDVE